MKLFACSHVIWLLDGGMNLRILSILILPCFIAGCSSISGNFPSLAKRPFESAQPSEEPINTPVESTLPVAIRAKIDVLGQRYDNAQSKFAAALPRVQSIAAQAQGAKMGGETWVNAQMELSRLDSARADAVAALADMNRLLSDQIDDENAGTAALYSPIIALTRERIANGVADQAQILDQMAQQIGL